MGNISIYMGKKNQHVKFSAFLGGLPLLQRKGCSEIGGVNEVSYFYCYLVVFEEFTVRSTYLYDLELVNFQLVEISF